MTRDVRRALSLLAALAAPVFLVAAVAGWLYGVWPATPVTLGIAAFVVCGGPILAIYHVATEGRHERVEELEPTVVSPCRPRPRPPCRCRSRPRPPRPAPSWTGATSPSSEPKRF